MLIDIIIKFTFLLHVLNVVKKVYKKLTKISFYTRKRFRKLLNFVFL